MVQFRMTITPDMGEAADRYGKVGARFDHAVLDDAFTEFERIPAREAKRRANARGSGWTRLASTIRPYRSGADATVGVEFGGLPDAAGWEFGAVKYPQFGRYLGFPKGYAVYSLVGDGSWFKEFAGDVAEDVWDEMAKLLTK